jgi:hypothetical protein
MVEDVVPSQNGMPGGKLVNPKVQHRRRAERRETAKRLPEPSEHPEETEGVHRRGGTKAGSKSTCPSMQPLARAAARIAAGLWLSWHLLVPPPSERTA